VPGGETYVCRRLARIIGGEVGGGFDGCEMIPMPSLLAEPSRPRDIMADRQCLTEVDFEFDRNVDGLEFTWKLQLTL